MSVKRIRKLIEKLESELVDMESELGDVESDLEIAIDERNDYEFLLSEKSEELESMENEIRLLCKLFFDSNVTLPLDGHYIDLNPYVHPNDPFKGKYDFE